MADMVDSASELESDTSSLDGGPTGKMPSPAQMDHLQRRIESLQQENRVLRMELDTYKAKYKTLHEENRELKKASVTIQARAEQEEEFISNTLLKKIQDLKKEKETLAKNYEQEEEYLTNDLSRKLTQLRQEKVELEVTLEKEQEYQVSKLLKKIEKLEADTLSKQNLLEQLRREKVELENTLEQEQEGLVNRLWKRMDKLEAEKRMLQVKLDQPVSNPPSPRDISMDGNHDMAGSLSQHIQFLRAEVSKLRNQLLAAQNEHVEKMAHYAQEEKHIREENLRLQRKLQLEQERREQLCRHLSESESSLEMDDERHFNEMTKQQQQQPSSSSSGGGCSGSGSKPLVPTGLPTVSGHHNRTVSSPIPVQSSGSSRPLSPGLHYGSAAFSPPSPMRCNTCMMQVGHSTPTPPTFLPGTSPPAFSHVSHHPATTPKVRPSPDKFVKPSAPPPHSPSQSEGSMTPQQQQQPARESKT